MNRRQCLITSLAGSGLAMVAGLRIHGAPLTQCCIEPIHRQFSGTRSAVLGAPYVCPGSKKTAMDNTEFHLDLARLGLPCDESRLILGQIEARGTTIRREDGLAAFTGTFRIYNGNHLLFQGTMTATDRIGTHEGFCTKETCDGQNHLEGWLDGIGGNDLIGYQLKAFLVATDKLPQPGTPTSVDLKGTLSGVVQRCM